MYFYVTNQGAEKQIVPLYSKQNKTMRPIGEEL